MIAYAENDYVCRSRQLLRYFGEEKSTDCGQCDVCRAHGGKVVDSDAFAAAKQEILDLLADGKPHSVGELVGCKADKDVCKEAVEYLMAEEKVHCRDGMLFL